MSEITENEDGSFSFRLTEEDWESMMKVLDAYPQYRPKLKALMQRTSPWEKPST